MSAETDASDGTTGGASAGPSGGPSGGAAPAGDDARATPTPTYAQADVYSGEIAAQRTGGGSSDPEAWRASAMFWLPAPIAVAGAVALVSGDLGRALAHLSAFALFLLGAYQLRDGRAETAAYHASAYAEPPSPPKKMLAALAVGLATGLTGFMSGFGLLAAPLLGVVAAGLHMAVFGLDPRGRKGAARIDGLDVRAALEAVDEAAIDLNAIDRAAAAHPDPGLRGPAEAMTDAARAVLEHLRGDPGDIRRARKFVKVYIPSARAAVEKYLAGHGVVDGALRERFQSLMAQMQAAAERQSAALLLDERADLEVEIEVLAQRLEQES